MLHASDINDQDKYQPFSSYIGPSFKTISYPHHRKVYLNQYHRNAYLKQYHTYWRQCRLNAWACWV